MSHYLVGVIVDNVTNVEKAVAEVLAPYDENMIVEPYIYKTKAELIANGKARKEKYSKETDIQDYMKPYLEATIDEELYELEIEDLEEDELDADGNELSTYNPKSKWDWWQIGGRFTNKDYTQLKDFILYDKLSDKELALYTRAWESFCGKRELDKEDEEAIFGGFRMWNNQYYIERYGTFDNYIREITSNIPYAFVDKNGWYEKGSMGWWGCDDATVDSINDYMEFAEEYFRAEENQNKYIVWVDCHI